MGGLLLKAFALNPKHRPPIRHICLMRIAGGRKARRYWHFADIGFLTHSGHSTFNDDQRD